MSSRPFGGDEQASTSNSTTSTLLAPFSACLPTSRHSSNANGTATTAPSFRAFFTQRQTEEESRRLLNDHDHSNNERSGRHANHDSDDSDAISLLSNIADRTGARSGASARRMARARAQRSRSRQSGWLGAGDLASSLLACGLFGRPKGAARDAEQPLPGRGDSLRSQNHNRSQSIGSIASSDGGQSVATTAWSDAEGGFGRLPRQGEEDAGSLGDETIAKLVHKQNTTTDHQADERRAPAVSDEEHAPSLPSAEAQEREEAELARQEEEAIARARRKAQRKAAKQQSAIEGSNEPSDENHGSFRHRSLWQTEAGAEAAAGCFAFAEDGDDGEMGGFQEANLGSERAIDEDLYEQDGDGQDKHFFEEIEEQQPQTIVHHHYYYDDEGQQSLDCDGETRSYTQVPALVVPAEPQQANEQKGDDSVENDLDEEEDADIAGLGLGRRRRGSKRSHRKRYGAAEGSQGSSSRTFNSADREATSASTDAYRSSSKQQQQQQQQHPLQLSPSDASYPSEPTTSSSLTSGGSITNQTSSSSTRSSSRPSYRDRPIRRGVGVGVGVGNSNAYLRSDERQDSKSTAATSVSSSASSSAGLEGSHESHRKGGSKARRAAARKAAASASASASGQQLTEEDKARRADAAAGGFD
ncbi:unnamed protein product [Jaminaea pallidilutea]